MGSKLSQDTTLWYPYTQMKTSAPPFHVDSAKGCVLTLKDGRELIDSVSSWWSVIHGYNHPELNQAIHDQVQDMAHIMLGGLTHDKAQQLAQELVNMTPDGLNHVFLSDSGSVGCEVALKMAIQYWFNQGNTSKTKCLSFYDAYHGDTTGVMGLSDPIEGMHSHFQPILSDHIFHHIPHDYDGTSHHPGLDLIQHSLKTHQDSLAAVIIEPIMQGAGGFKLHHPEFLQWLSRQCRELNILLIFDEVATGFGRTGTLFAADQAGVSPDIMIVGKGLTGGYMGLAGTLTTTSVFESFYQEDSDACLMHGPTYTGNPLACAVALKSAELVQRPETLMHVKRIEAQLQQLHTISSDHIKDCRVKGAMGVIEVHDASVLTGLTQFAASQGVWMRSFNTYCYTMPPFVISDKELHQVMSVMDAYFSTQI